MPWDNDDGVTSPMGLVLYGYAVYSSITGAFWQIRYERPKGFPLPAKIPRLGEATSSDSTAASPVCTTACRSVKEDQLGLPSIFPFSVPLERVFIFMENCGILITVIGCGVIGPALHGKLVIGGEYLWKLRSG